MTRTVPAGILSAIQSESFRLPMLVHIALADGSVLTFTDWDVPLVVDLLGDGARTYSPNKMAGLSAFSAQINAPIDDSELILIIDTGPPDSPPDSPPDRDPVIANDIRRGAYDNAVVTRGYVVPTALGAPWLYCVYDTGQASIDGLKISLELLGPEKRLEQPVGRKLTANCPWTFGDHDCGLQVRAPIWLATQAYALNTIVKRTAGFGIYWFRATTPGTSGGTEPTWPTIAGNTVVDGTVTWTAFRERRGTGSVITSSNRRTLVTGGVPVVADYWAEGFLTWLTGANAGDTRRVKSDDGAGTLVLQIATFDDIQPGDLFEVVAGCRKRMTEDCINKHHNEEFSRTLTLRFGGFPFLAEENVTMTAPKG